MTNLLSLSQRIKELEELATEIEVLAKLLLDASVTTDVNLVQPQLSIKWQRWYRWARELMIQNNFSGLRDFDNCYTGLVEDPQWKRTYRCFEFIENFFQYLTNPHDTHWIHKTNKEEHYWLFYKLFTQARSLIFSLQDEVKSREIIMKIQLSFDLVSEEFEMSESMLVSSNGNDILVRAAGVICRVWLERHILTIIQEKNLVLVINPPHKKKAEASDYLETLSKNSLIKSVQKTQLELLFRIWNNCAHPKEVVTEKEVQKMISDARDLCSVIV